MTAYVTNRDELGKCDVYLNRTASGTRPRVGTVAVDTNQFRFGTRFYIPGYGYGVARDRGGLITWGRLDIVQPTCSAAFKWGRRTVPVKVQ